MFGELHGFFSGLWWWGILISLLASIVLGLASLSVVYVLSKKLGFVNNFVLVSILVFSFTLTLGVFWETFEFFLDLIIGSGLQKGLIDTMQDIIINIFGALIISLAGGFYLSRGDDYLVSTFFSGLIDKNFSFGSARTARDIVFELCKRSESEILEFKSSLRTNLHTGESDKKMEFGVLKTIVAFLNSKGGNLLIGVDDSGEILGLDSDSFPSDDKMALHLTNLIRTHIGNEFLPFVKFKVVEINFKKIILVSCKKSKRRVFLKIFGSEEFYVRNGPASVSLQGNSLVDYIEHRFGRLR